MRNDDFNDVAMMVGVGTEWVVRCAILPAGKMRYVLVVHSGPVSRVQRDETVPDADALATYKSMAQR